MPSHRMRPLAGALLVLAGCTGGPAGSPTPASATPQASVATPAPATPQATPTTLWPAPANAMDLTVAAGLVPETVEHLEFHVHAHLDVFLDGEPVLVPAGIGINIADPNVKVFTESDGSFSYGGIEAPCSTPCISPLHTHWEVGTLHTESATPEPNTLGQFFVEWNVELSQTCVGEHCAPDKEIAFYVNTEPYTGDPNDIELADQTLITIVIGTPPAELPTDADYSLP
jgi:hypothetical protein